MHGRRVPVEVSCFPTSTSISSALPRGRLTDTFHYQRLGLRSRFLVVVTLSYLPVSLTCIQDFSETCEAVSGVSLQRSGQSVSPLSFCGRYTTNNRYGSSQSCSANPFASWTYPRCSAPDAIRTRPPACEIIDKVHSDSISATQVSQGIRRPLNRSTGRNVAAGDFVYFDRLEWEFISANEASERRQA